MSFSFAGAGHWLGAIGFALILQPSSFGQAEPPKEKSTPPEKNSGTLVNDDTTSVLAESAGLFSSLQLYNAYLNIGILADAMGDDLYEVRQGYQLLGSIVQPLERVEKQLVRMAKLKLPKEDIDAINRLIKVAGLLRQQGKELELYWDKGLVENGKRYETARQAAWKELSSILDLEPKNEKLSEPRTSTSPLPPKKP